MTDHGRTFQFTDDDLLLFSAASGDRNPLHLSPEYATRTSYGAQVVFGALGAVAALGCVPEEASRHVRGLQVDFLRPMFLGVEYRIQVTPQDNGLLSRVFDGSSTVVSAALKLGEPWPDPKIQTAAKAEFPRSEAIEREESELTPGLSVRGVYATDQSARAKLCARWGVTAALGLVDMLLWSSYLVGMEVPGKTALFSRFSIDAFGSRSTEGGLLEYEAAVEQVDKRLGQIRIRARLWRDQEQTATVECRAFNRPASPSLDAGALAHQLPPSSALAGKKALVVGASRGLGAALAYALASQGAKVIAVSRSASIDATGQIEFIAGDAADARWREQLRAKILTKHGGLDLLIANAFPALLPLLMEENTCARIEEFLSRATAMTLGPLCSFLETLSAAQGSAVLISSVAVEQPVKEWPHYVAAKKAAEALFEVAALQNPKVGFLVVRPEKMLTEMTNTPLGRRNAIAPEHMAVRIVQRIAQGIGGYQLLR